MLDSNEVSDGVRRRIMAFYTHKYRGGKITQHEQTLQELPYNMQVNLMSTDACAPVCTSCAQSIAS